MALATLHWRMLPPIIVSNPSISTFMDAIYVAGTSTVYADGTTRTPGTFASPGTASLPATLGTGSAWTWNYDNTTYSTGLPGGPKTACYAYPPTTTAINQALIVAGAASVASPAAAWKQMNGDSRSATYPFVGLAKNSGTYTSWNNATTPFTSGDFTGFGIFGIPAQNYNTLFMWESEEGVIIQLANATGTSGFIAGAVVDPLSANTANAETDGRLYGVSCTGSANVMAGTWLSSNTAASACFFTHSATANDPHSNTFTPGAGTLTATWRFGTFAPSTQFTSRNGDLPEIPFQIFDGSTKYLGQLRQIFVTRDGITGTAWNVGSTPKGYLLGYTLTAAAGDCVLLAY